MDYKQYEFLIDPTKRYTKEEWEKGFKVLDRFGQKRKIYTLSIKL